MGVWYCTREALKASLDVKVTARDNALVDASLEAASRDVEAQLHRVFWPWTGTRYADWPNYARARAWELWLDEYEIISVSQLLSGAVVIPPTAYNLEPNASGPPYSLIELNRSMTSAFTVSGTPQRSVAITGVFGYRDDTAPAGAATGPLSSSGTTLTVSDGSLTGVGDLLLMGSERMLVTNRRSAASGDTCQSVLSASLANDSLGVTSGAAWDIGELIVVGTERMLVVDILGNTLNVKRAYDGSVLTAHSIGDAIFSARQLTVVRGYAGTTAASHLTADPILKSAWPGNVTELCMAEAENNYLQKVGGYARNLASDSGAAVGSKVQARSGLPDIRARAMAANGRQMRVDAV